MGDTDTNAGNNDHLVQSDDPDHPANLIPELCKRFYQWGWVTGMLPAESNPSLPIADASKALVVAPRSRPQTMSTSLHQEFKRSS
jgi:hypothetical protein